MTLLVANVGLFLVLGAAAFLVSRRVQDRTRVQVGFLLAVVSLPAASYSLYYFHWFDGWSWFYRFRSFPLANFYPASLGALAGWWLPSLRRPALRVAAVAALGLFVVVPFLKPVLLPLDSQQLRNRWHGSVCLQSTPSTCGPASVATILATAFGDVVPENEIARAARTASTGTEVWYLAQFLRARGYEVSFRHSPVPIPYSVAGTQVGGAGHFVAVLGCDEGRCQVGDPLAGIVSNDRGVRFIGFYMQIRSKRSTPHPPSAPSPLNEGRRATNSQLRSAS